MAGFARTLQLPLQSTGHGQDDLGCDQTVIEHIRPTFRGHPAGSSTT
jgi:hypothetical protein